MVLRANLSQPADFIGHCEPPGAGRLPQNDFRSFKATVPEIFPSLDEVVGLLSQAQLPCVLQFFANMFGHRRNGMKTVICLTVSVVLLLLAPRFSLAQETAVSQVLEPALLNTVSFQPAIALQHDWYVLEYERAFDSAASAFVATSFGVGSESNPFTDLSWSGVGLEMGVRLFPWGWAPEGFFFSPAVGVAKLWGQTSSGTEGSAFGFFASTTIGYTFVIADLIDLSFGFGLGYANVSAVAQSSNDSGRDGTAGFFPATRAAVGFVF